MGIAPPLPPLSAAVSPLVSPIPFAHAAAAAPAPASCETPSLALVNTVHLPDPTALPPIDDMSAGDMVRELVAVTVQREAETAAALEAVDRPFAAAPLRSQLAETDKHADAKAVKGTLLLEGRVWVESASDAVAGGLEARLETPTVLIDYTLEETGGIDRPFYQDRAHLSLDVSLAPTSAASPTGNPTSPAVVQLRLRHSAALPSETLAYAVPRPAAQVLPGVPCVGPPPAKDAMRVLKELMAAPAPPSATAMAPAAAAQGVFAPALEAAAACGGADAAPLPSASLPLLHSTCRLFPHSHLTAAQSEERTQALVERIKNLTGYDFTPPCAPTASRALLGSTHAPKPFSARPPLPHAARSPAPRGVHSASAPVVPPTPIVTTTTTAAAATTVYSLENCEQGISGNPSAGSSSHQASSPAPNERRGGGGQKGSFPALLSPVPSLAAPAGAFTPAPSVRRTISRYLSSCDLSRRSGTSPAHFDREHHQSILQLIQVRGLAVGVGFSCSLTCALTFFLPPPSGCSTAPSLPNSPTTPPPPSPDDIT
jgi:hypothetical protein